MCVIAIGSSAVINSAVPEQPEFQQENDQTGVEEFDTGDLSTAESANPQYLGKMGFYFINT